MNLVEYLSKLLECNINDLVKKLKDPKTSSFIEEHLRNETLLTTLTDNKFLIPFYNNKHYYYSLEVNCLTKRFNSKSILLKYFPKKINVVDYFNSKYNIVLQYPELPLIVAEDEDDKWKVKRIYFPMELLEAPFQCKTPNCPFTPAKDNIRHFYCKNCQNDEIIYDEDSNDSESYFSGYSYEDNDYNETESEEENDENSEEEKNAVSYENSDDNLISPDNQL